jgi:hypothetical protein
MQGRSVLITISELALISNGSGYGWYASEGLIAKGNPFLQSCNRFLNEYENYCIINCLLELNSPAGPAVLILGV